MKNIMTLSQKSVRKEEFIAAFRRKNTRDSVGNHMPAKGIQQTRDNPKKPRDLPPTGKYSFIPPFSSSLSKA